MRISLLFVGLALIFLIAGCTHNTSLESGVVLEPSLENQTQIILPEDILEDNLTLEEFDSLEDDLEELF